MVKFFGYIGKNNEIIEYRISYCDICDKQIDYHFVNIELKRFAISENYDVCEECFTKIRKMFKKRSRIQYDEQLLKLIESRKIV